MQQHPQPLTAKYSPTPKETPLAGVQLNDDSVLVIGGTGGIGTALVDRLLHLGAPRIVVASARQPSSPRPHPRIATETVNVTNKDSLIALANRLESLDISLLINCAGINGNGRLYDDDSEKTARREMEVNYFGLMNIADVFAPRMAARGGGTMMTVLSFLSHINLPTMATYCASKAAAHSLTQALRSEWAKQNVRFCGVYPTAVDTQMSADQVGAKQSPDELAAEMLDAVERGDEDIFPGLAGEAYSELLRDPKSFERNMARSLS